jgi:3-carboxy-cis,cis-muconate cycloisomerase
VSSVSPLDWAIYPDFYCAQRMRDVFSEQGAIARMVEVERAASAVQGKLGLIPAQAAQAIVSSLDASAIDRQRLGEDTVDVGRPVIGLARQFAEQVGEPNTQWVHYGFRTYDVMDSGTALQVRDATKLLLERLASLAAI